MTPTTTVLLVAGREIVGRLRNKAFVIGTAIAGVLVVVAVVLPAVLSDDEPPSYELGVAGPVPDGFDDAVGSAAAPHEAAVELIDLEPGDEAVTAVADGDVDAALIDGRELMVDGLPDTTLQTIVDTALRTATVAAELEGVGLTADELAAVLEPREPVTVIDTAGETDDGETDVLIALAATVILFAAIAVNAGLLLTGAVEEKSNRIVEVLLGSMRPWQLLTGKLTAMTVVALGQVGLVVGAGLAANTVVGTLELPEATAATLATGLVMVVAGFLFFAALYAVAGSMASSIEDAQGAAGPLGFVLFGTYMLVVIAVIPAPDGMLAQVLSFLPPTAPFTVPARVALGAIPGWQVVASVLVTIAGAALSVRLAGRLYGAALLAGGKLTWRETWRAEPVR